jgi:hypothetical protein
MSKKVEFELLTADLFNEHGDPEFACSRVTDYPFVAQGRESLVLADVVITKATRIQIIFDYPLNKPVTLEFENEGGFRRVDLMRVIHEGYTKLYAEAREAASGGYTEFLDGDTRVLRPAKPSNWWGHTIEDLYLEGAEEIQPGVFTLAMGS